MGSDNEKPSRLNQRSFGVTNRIWLLLSFVLFVLVFTRLILPSSPSSPSSPSFQPLDFSDLTPKNYLNASEQDPNPFKFCPVFGPGDELAAKYGAVTLSQSRMHLGSGARIQRVIRKALLGQPVTISIIGGSVSACHGAGDDPLSPKCYPSLFFQWWNTIFPHPASELTNGAMRKTNSDYFGFCNGHHVPDKTDLVILELDADDGADKQSMENFELLVRSILMRPDQPAIIILGHFSPQVHQAHGFAGPDHWHSVVAQFYDVPHISIKPALFPDYIHDPLSISQYYADPVLANAQGHQILTDVLTSYLQSQICGGWSAATGQSADILPIGQNNPNSNNPNAKQPVDAKGLFGGIGQRKGAAAGSDGNGGGGGGGAGGGEGGALWAQFRVPPTRISTPSASNPNPRPYEEIAPFCVSANDLINPLPPSLFYGSGWRAAHDQGKSYYWFSTMPASRMRVPIQVGAGDVGVYYLNEGGGEEEESAVECWVDDNYGGAREIGNGGGEGAALEIIDHYVTRGSHYVECQLLGEEGTAVRPFKIMGIFST